uniref:Uncharacterized protein n=1 Tax=Anguilla anguilla TaxID=7936 RepID=A0A0E9W836_ANGAN
MIQVPKLACADICCWHSLDQSSLSLNKAGLAYLLCPFPQIICFL